ALRTCLLSMSGPPATAGINCTVNTSVYRGLAASLAEEGKSRSGFERISAGSNAPANPAPPATLPIRPAPLLHLQPSLRRSTFVQTRLVLRDVALTVSRDHFRPCFVAVLSESSHGKYEIGVRDNVFQPNAAFAKRASC